MKRKMVKFSRPFGTAVVISSLLALLLPGEASLSKGRGAEPYIGTFAAVNQTPKGDYESVVLRVEARNGSAQVTGESYYNGRLEARLKGTYYPRSNEFRLESSSPSGHGQPRPIDGRFIPSGRTIEVWSPDRTERKVKLLPFTLDLVEGYYEGEQLRLSVTPKPGGVEVSGTYYGKAVRGSYLAKSNMIAARIGESSNPEAVVKVNGHFNPATGKLMVWMDNPTASESPKLELSKRLGGARPPHHDVTPLPSLNPGDPAAAPGAVWKQKERYQTLIGGTWTLQPDGRTFKARWNNGAEATLTLTSISAIEVVITRHDLSGVSKGLKAKYEGKRTGNKVEGKVSWTWADGKKGDGTWSADLPG